MLETQEPITTSRVPVQFTTTVPLLEAIAVSTLVTQAQFLSTEDQLLEPTLLTITSMEEPATVPAMLVTVPLQEVTTVHHQIHHLTHHPQMMKVVKLEERDFFISKANLLQPMEKMDQMLVHHTTIRSILRPTKSDQERLIQAPKLTPALVRMVPPLPPPLLLKREDRKDKRPPVHQKMVIAIPNKLSGITIASETDKSYFIQMK